MIQIWIPVLAQSSMPILILDPEASQAGMHPEAQMEYVTGREQTGGPPRAENPAFTVLRCCSIPRGAWSKLVCTHTELCCRCRISFYVVSSFTFWST
ncbi:hypothetical protein KIL84_003236 [Mauremys mutica]|uniref:Uncharacterized protein n=1 Tax=Mauremys mutica TaxID=74926 RepID=A0A9D3WUT1_9SAUR|nr:hypothetical protein KIL84_003236 [Mauremys mutica]